jgi:hypothetical protein
LVYAYNADETAKYPSKSMYATIDCLFFDSSGRSLPEHYRMISGIYFSQRGSGVADGYITITPSGENIQRFKNRRIFCGPINNGSFNLTNSSNAQQVYSDYLDNKNLSFMNGEMNFRSGDIRDDVTLGITGWGGVLGVIGDDYNALPLDCGVINQNMRVIANTPSTVLTSNPSSAAAVYWDNPSSPLTLNITGLKYWGSGACFGGATTPLTGIPGSIGQAPYNWATNPCGFCAPTGFIIHREYINTMIGSDIEVIQYGNRLLPSFGTPNNQNINTYSLSRGGYYPGLSMDNGLELALDIMWSSKCSDPTNQNCVDSGI